MCTKTQVNLLLFIMISSFLSFLLTIPLVSSLFFLFLICKFAWSIYSYYLGHRLFVFSFSFISVLTLREKKEFHRCFFFALVIVVVFVFVVDSKARTQWITDRDRDDRDFAIYANGTKRVSNTKKKLRHQVQRT